jgi:predicted ribosomally synthesized peptide with SipW-like signal peptide
VSRSRKGLRLWSVLALAALVGALAITGTVAAFSDSTDNASNMVTAAPDFAAPQVSSAVVAKTAGYDPSYVKQAGTYYVYANVAADTGNPASGIASVRANSSSFDTGQSAVALTAGSYSVGGVPYNYRSAALGADNPLTAGGRAFSVTATDTASNASTFNGSLTVDNTAPTAADVQSANGGTVAGRPELSDTVTFTYSEPIDPESILTGWTGTQTDVTVRVNHGGQGNDSLLVYNPANTAQLPLGTVNLGRTDYVSANRTFGATGTKAKMTRSGNSITVVLGTQSGAGTTAATNGTMAWTPSASAYDRAGNANTTAAANETGAADREF